MGQALGPRQLEIAQFLLKRKQPLDVNDLVRLIYKREPTITLQNIVWSSLRGMEKRRTIQPAGKSQRGSMRWELTKMSRKEIEALKNTENVSVFPG